MGTLVDAGHRVMLLREATARRAAWERNEAALHPEPQAARIAALDRSPRPEPVPDGVVERYARGVSLGSLGVSAAAFGMTRDPRTFADVVIAAIPRAARLGRDGFCAQLVCLLAERNVLVMDPRALRRLDRVDTVVIDEALLATPSAATQAVVESTRAAAQDFVVAGGGPESWERLEPDVVVDGDDQLHASIRGLQAEGRVVAVVSGSARALAAADCGIGVTVSGHHPPWGADLICPNLAAAALVIDATALARTASRRVVAVAAGGSTLAAALAFRAVPGRGSRVQFATGTASLVALAAGAWTATGIARRPVPLDDGPDVAWHALDGADAETLLGTGRAGLSAREVAKRHTDDGVPAAPSFAALFTQELANPLTLLLAAGGALSTAVGSVTDGALIMGVLGVNAVIGAGQRLRTEEAIGRLSASVTSRLVRVRRDDTELSVAPDALVPGDLVVLRAGDIVPADCRIVHASGIEADESALTGESLPVAKDTDAVALETPVAERRSMAFAGTAISAGRGEAIVVGTGNRTEARRGMAEGARPPASGVETRLEHLTRATVPLVLAAGALLTGSSMLRRVPVREAVSTGVSLAAAAVPEGLPFLATVAQAGAARRLSRRGVLVRNARVLEALGRVDVLCFDKTGTLTEGHLRLRSVSDGELVEVMPAIDGRRRLVLAAALRATPRPRQRGLPHPTDQVVVDGAAAVELDNELGAPGWHKIASLPFAPSRGYHAVLGRSADGYLLCVKGAPEQILPRCDTWQRADRAVELGDRERSRLERHAARLAAQGLRVLAVAQRAASGRADLDDDRVDRLGLVGFVTVADVARPSAVEPIAQLQHAGIAVVMLTGDHPSTAEAIASELGLLDGGVVSGARIDMLSDDELDALVGDATVFARVTPSHKVRIVQSIQRTGRVVAMTGDGANDAQAIRLADIGVAFGPHATPAARAAADLVVVEDRVETLIESIIEGRAMWASVRDALALLLGGNLGEVIFTAGAGLVTGRSPLNARQLLAVNLLTDLAPAMALALQPPLTRDVDLRREGPDTSLGGALARDVAVRAAATAGAAGTAWTVARFTGTPTRARTVALAALVGAQLGQTLLVGYRSPLVLASGLVSTGALVTIVQTPGVSQFFGCRPLGPVGWSIAACAAGGATVGAAAAGALLGRNRANGSEAKPVIDLREALPRSEPSAAQADV
jgi:cation-transporting ATPase I